MVKMKTARVRLKTLNQYENRSCSLNLKANKTTLNCAVHDVTQLTGKHSGWRMSEFCHNRGHRRGTARCCTARRSSRPRISSNTGGRQNSFEMGLARRTSNPHRHTRIRKYCIWSESGAKALNLDNSQHGTSSKLHLRHNDYFPSWHGKSHPHRL